jgi:capsular polysaccharide biosynthesis protein
VSHITNKLGDRLSATTEANFRIYRLSFLQKAESGTLVRPDTRRNLLFGGIAGAIVGAIAAALFVEGRATGRTRTAEESAAKRTDARESDHAWRRA